MNLCIVGQVSGISLQTVLLLLPTACGYNLVVKYNNRYNTTGSLSFIQQQQQQQRPNNKQEIGFINNVNPPMCCLGLLCTLLKVNHSTFAKHSLSHIEKSILGAPWLKQTHIAAYLIYGLKKKRSLLPRCVLGCWVNITSNAFLQGKKVTARGETNEMHFIKIRYKPFYCVPFNEYRRCITSCVPQSYSVVNEFFPRSESRWWKWAVYPLLFFSFLQKTNFHDPLFSTLFFRGLPLHNPRGWDEDRTNFPDTGEGAQDLQANSVQRQPERAITLHMACSRKVEKNSKTDSCEEGPVCFLWGSLSILYVFINTPIVSWEVQRLIVSEVFCGRPHHFFFVCLLFFGP